MTRSDDISENNDSDGNSDLSDSDYKLSSRELDVLCAQGISEERANYLWNKQSGLCYVTNHPLIIKQGFSGMYIAVVSPRCVNSSISDTNSILVCREVSMMRDAVSMTWTQFKALLQSISCNLE